MFASFQNYVYICTKFVAPYRRYSALTVGQTVNLRERNKEV